MEPNIRRPLKPDLTTFTTKQGVTFGVFICFDILFDSPANELVRRGVRNFVMPTRWHSELPYLTGMYFCRGSSRSRIYCSNCSLEIFIHLCILSARSTSNATNVGARSKCHSFGCWCQFTWRSYNWNVYYFRQHGSTCLGNGKWATNSNL